MDPILLSKADISDLEERYVVEALRSSWVAPLGPHVDAFEAEIAARVGVAHALAVSSGTAGLHLALLELGARPRTAVVVPTMTFAASAMPVVYTGAEPVFVDASADGNIDPQLLLHAVDTLSAEGTNVVAAMSVDVFGRCAEYDDFSAALEERGVPLLEDAAEAFGASYRGQAAGAFGAAAVLSFNGNKVMTTSGGGMLLSDDAHLIERARYLSSQARQPVDHYEHTEVGYNYRLSNLLAAVGRAQLERLDGMVARRRQIREMYVDGLSGAPGVSFLGRDGHPDGDAGRGDDDDNCWLTCLLLDPAQARATAAEVIAALAADDIEARRLWKPTHLQPVFASRRSFVTGMAERLFDRGVALPSGSALDDDDIARVIRRLRATLVRGS